MVMHLKNRGRLFIYIIIYIYVYIRFFLSLAVNGLNKLNELISGVRT